MKAQMFALKAAVFFKEDKVMKRIIVGSGVLLLMACAVKHTSTDFRTKFARSAKKPLLVEASYDKVYGGILEGAKKCYEKTVKTTRGSGAHMDELYDITILPVKNGISTIEIKYLRKTKDSFDNQMTLDSYVGIIDIKKVGDKKTEVIPYLRKGPITDAIEIWATTNDRPCPTE